MSWQESLRLCVKYRGDKSEDDTTQENLEKKQRKRANAHDPERKDEHDQPGAPALALGIPAFERLASATPIAAAAAPAKAAANQ